jgi:hypothetical protein
MPTYSENGKNSYTAAATVAQGTIVKFSGSVDSAGLPTVTPTTAATDAAIGVALMPANAGEKVAVKILGSGGTTLVIAGGAVTVGAQVAADGTATAADTDVIIGRALSAASAANDVIEVVTQVGQVK